TFRQRWSGASFVLAILFASTIGPATSAAFPKSKSSLSARLLTRCYAVSPDFFRIFVLTESLLRRFHRKIPFPALPISSEATRSPTKRVFSPRKRHSQFSIPALRTPSSSFFFPVVDRP